MKFPFPLERYLADLRDRTAWAPDYPLETLDGPRIVVALNGVKVTDFTEGQPVPPKHASYEPDRGPRPDRGYIGLQNHPGDPVYFREVSVRPL